MKVHAKSWNLENPSVGGLLEFHPALLVGSLALGRRYFYVEIYLR